MILGAVLGFLETVFVYATGHAPSYEIGLIWLCTLSLCCAWGAAMAAAVTLLGRATRVSFPAHGRLRDLGLLLFPPLLFALRGNVDPQQVNNAWGPAARWGVTLAALIVLCVDALAERGHRNEPLPTSHFVLLSIVSQFLVVAGFTVRTIDLTVTRDLLSSDSANRIGLPLAVLLCALYAAWVWNRRAGLERRRNNRLGVSLATGGLLVLSGAVALQLHSRPPWLPGTQSSPGPAPAGAPNVLLIVLDTVRQDHVSSYGYSRRTTPNLDAFAERSIVFEEARATATYSLSSHASLFTGLLPSAHGAHPIPAGAERDAVGNRGNYRLLDGVDTLAEELQRQNYLTAGISGNDIFLAPWTGLQRGFAEFACHAKRSYRFVPTFMPIVSRLGPRAVRDFPYHQEWPAPAIADAAIAWLDSTRGRPGFLFLNFFDAHAPYSPEPPYDEMFSQGESLAGLPFWRSREDEKDRWPYWTSQYDGEIAYTDAALGRLLARLETSGAQDNSLVIVTSDHGEFLGERGIFGRHADQLLEPVLRVPLIVRLPGQRAGLRTRVAVSLAQVREIVRLTLRGERSPEQLVAALDNRGPVVMAESWYSPLVGPDLPASTPRVRAIYLGPFKLVERAGGPDQLFKIAVDPLEEHDLFATDPALARAVQARIGSSVPPLEGPAHGRELPVLDAEALEKLRSLGYLGEPTAVRRPDKERP